MIAKSRRTLTPTLSRKREQGAPRALPALKYFSRRRKSPSPACGRRWPEGPDEGSPRRSTSVATYHPMGRRHAAFRFALSQPRLTSTSAICTAFSAAPLRKLSETHHKTRPLSTVGSSRMREI